VDVYRDYLRHDRYDTFWQALNFRGMAAKVQTPMLLIGGWYDYYSGETFANYRALREQAPDPALADAHRVIIGPWSHGFGASKLGEIDFGAESRRETDATIRWMNCLLRDGSTPKDFQEAPIRLFVMGINRWRDERQWPLARTRWTDFHLHSTGQAGETITDGTLATEAPLEEEPPDTFTYDPAAPVPTWGGNHSIGPWNPGLYEKAPPGPFDQRKIESRRDVLVYTTKPLEEDVEVTGPATVTLYAASSARDTDFVARLCDVHPDGRSINITEGILRARFRDGNWSKPVPIEPGQPLKYTIQLEPTSFVFARGHSIRVQITSSCFPLWDANPNTGGPISTETRLERAHQTIHHSRPWPSCVRLPVIPQEKPNLISKN
jgi:putative CocE/NonD family hydrolase